MVDNAFLGNEDAVRSDEVAFADHPVIILSRGDIDFVGTNAVLEDQQIEFVLDTELASIVQSDFNERRSVYSFADRCAFLLLIIVSEGLQMIASDNRMVLLIFVVVSWTESFRHN